MDKKSIVFFWVFFLALATSVGATYSRMFITKNYEISTEVECDPRQESCFVWHCLPDSDDQDMACTGDPIDDLWYYKIVTKPASSIEACDPNEQDCPEVACEEGEIGCRIDWCDEALAEEDERCVDESTVEAFESEISSFIDMEAYYMEEDELEEVEDTSMQTEEVGGNDSGEEQLDDEEAVRGVDLDFIKTTVIKLNN